MQKLLFKFAGLGLVLATLMFTACGEETPGGGGTGGGGTVLGPEISFVSDVTAQNVDFDVEETATTFRVIVRTIKGDGDLQNLEITEGSTQLSTDRFTIADAAGSITPNNPLLILGTAIDGTDYTIDITFPTLTVGDFLSYAFKVTDKNGESATVDIIASVVAPPGTALDNPDGISGVLLNQAGPAGTGGLDLDLGAGTGSSDMTAEIRDLGIDCTIPVTMENWRAQFGTVNGAEMVRLDASQLENFSYETVSTKEAIQDAFTSAGAQSLGDGVSQAPNCDETTVTDVTGTVAVNDLFVLKSGDKYYLLRVDAVNFVHSASDPGIRNDDNYEFSVKF